MKRNPEGTGGRAYSMAGSALLPPVRLFAGDRVDVPDARADQDERVCFRAPAGERSGRRGIRLHVAMLLMVFLLGLMFSQISRRAVEEKHLKEEYLRIAVAMVEAERRQADLKDSLSKVGDESYICYRAAQELGMKLATGSEVVWVEAPATRSLPERNRPSYLGSSETGLVRQP